jgi:ABC-type transport system involved in Fe-S cluster assembly fused permease/ATPase subunit
MSVQRAMNTIRDADTILVLDYGRIEEHGTHTELLAVGGTPCSSTPSSSP